MIKLKDLLLTEASSKVKRQIKNIMRYDHIDDLADYIKDFDIPKKYWRKMSMLFNRIRDEVQGRKPEGYADRYRKDLQRLLFKVIKEGKLTEARYKTISLKDKKGFKQAERLQRQGWVVKHVGLFTIDMVKEGVKEEKLAEYRIRGNAANLVIRKGDIKKGMMVWFEDGRGSAKKLKVKHVMLSKDKKEEHYITNRGTFTPRDVVGY